MMEWINQYIGQPWVNGAADCWALVRSVYRDRLGIELPQIAVDADNLRTVVKTMTQHPALADWIPLDSPEHLSCVFFSNRANPTHVGVYLNYHGGRILHSYKGAGCVLQSLHDLRMNGWTRPKYYRHKLK